MSAWEAVKSKMGVVGFFGGEQEEAPDYYGARLDKNQKKRAVSLGNTFDTPDGKVLFKRLVLKPIFDTMEEGDTQAVSRHNEAVSLLAEIGVLEYEKVSAVIDSILALRYKGDVK